MTQAPYHMSSFLIALTRPCFVFMPAGQPERQVEWSL